MAPGRTIIDQDQKQDRTGRAVLFGLAAYFLLSVFFRIMVSGTADMDETELLVYTQALRPGYGAQLPLYVWLQFLSFSLFGINILALSVLKYGLLFSTYMCVMKIAEKVLHDQKGSALAALSLFLVPQVGWESYRTLTNTVLATCLAALTLLVILRLKEKPTTPNYLLLGAVAGLGMLSKYNYAIFITALIAAAIATPGFRKTLLSGRSALSLTAALAITLPPYAWIAVNLERATASSGKLTALGSGSQLKDILLGFGSLAAAWIGYFWPALIVYGSLFFLTKPVRTTSHDDGIHQLISRTLFASFLICSMLVVFFNVTYFKERWMQPLLFFLPVYFMYYLNSRLSRKRFRILVTAAIIPALLAMLAFSGSVLFASRTGRATRLSPPYRAMAARIQEQGFAGGVIITDNHRIGGNFRLHFRDSTILVPGMMEHGFQRSAPALILWNADRSELPPEGLTRYAAQMFGTGIDPAGTRYVEEPLLYWEGKTMRLGYYMIK